MPNNLTLAKLVRKGSGALLNDAGSAGAEDDSGVVRRKNKGVCLGGVPSVQFISVGVFCNELQHTVSTLTDSVPCVDYSWAGRRSTRGEKRVSGTVFEGFTFGQTGSSSSPRAASAPQCESEVDVSGLGNGSPRLADSDEYPTYDEFEPLVAAYASSSNLLNVDMKGGSSSPHLSHSLRTRLPQDSCRSIQSSSIQSRSIRMGTCLLHLPVTTTTHSVRCHHLTRPTYPYCRVSV
jgi:hypothetical protein